MKRTIALGVLASVVLAGCGSTENKAPEKPAANGGSTSAAASSPAGATSPATLPPAEAVAAAVTGISGKNVKFTIHGDEGEMTGEFDASSGAGKLTGTVEGTKTEIIGVGDDVYLGGLMQDGKWAHALASKFKDGAIGFLTLVDPLFGQKFLSTAADVKQDQPGTYSGTIDLTKVTATGVTKRIADKFAKSAGSKAKALPFTATLGKDNAFTEVNITFPKADIGGKDLKYKLKIAEIGGPVTVAVPPKNKTAEAPASIYTGP